jgi:hypothetical protein
MPEALAFLERARREPCAVFREFGKAVVDRDTTRLIEWIGKIQARALPDYVWTEIEIDGADDPMRGAHALETPTPLIDAEQGWAELVPLDKPFSIEWLPHGAAFAWEKPEGWLDWLVHHPEAADSLNIIDDLVSLILSHPDGELPWVRDKALEPLLDRALAILERAQEGVSSAATLPWLIDTNRPALRLLTRAIAYAPDRVGIPGRMPLMRWYLRLNPSDNHGWRAPLVNALLERGEDREALAVIEHYPDDMSPEIVYGKVLALYRSGAKGRALTALAEARDRLPLVLDFLARDKVRRPALSDDGRYVVGGKDQAWFYREAMRDTWLQTEGAMDMLRGLRAKRS